MDKLTIRSSWVNNQDQEFSIIEESLENEKIVDGQHILARVVGPSFFPETTSGNGVFYPLEAWENALNDEQFLEDLHNRRIYGTIGHDLELTDNEIRDGKFSHIISKVWIDENNIGMAEYLIVNTEPGRTLNMLLRAKSKLRVSTKARGFFESSPNRRGGKSVKSESFILERIDFIREPGYVNAMPDLVESVDNLNKKEGVVMSVDDKTSNTKVEDILENQIKELKSDKIKVDEALVSLNSKVTSLSEELTKAKSKLEQYEALGTVQSLYEAQQELTSYSAIGSVQEINEALDKSEEVIDDLTGEVASLQDQDDSDDIPAEYADLGTADELDQVLDATQALVSEVEQYRELGSVDELEELVQKSEELVNDMTSTNVSEICTKYNLPEQDVQDMLDKGMTIEDINSICDKIQANKQAATDAPTDEPKEPNVEESRKFGTNMIRKLSKPIEEGKSKSNNPLEPKSRLSKLFSANKKVK